MNRFNSHTRFPPALALAVMLALPLSTPKADVVLVPGTIEGTVSLGGETIIQMRMHAHGASGDAQQWLNPNAASAPFELTVNVPAGGTAEYTVSAQSVRTRDAVTHPVDDDYLGFPGQTVTVDETTPANVDFTLPSPNHVRGAVTLTGAGSLTYVQVIATPLTFNGWSHYTIQRADAATANYREFEFPVSPGPMRCYGTAYLTNGGRISLPPMDVSPVGGVVHCDWEIDTPEEGAIEGSIGFTGSETPDRFYLFLGGATSRSLNLYTPDNPQAYAFEGLPVGRIGVNAIAYLNSFDDDYRFPRSAFTPDNFTDVAAGDVDQVDIDACQAYLDGTVGLIGAAQWADVTYSEISVHGRHDSSLPDGGPSSGGHSRDRLDLADGTYDLVLSPGEWLSSYIFLRFYDPAPADFRNHWVYIYDRSVMYTANPADLPACGAQAWRDFEYNLGQVTVNFAVDGDAVLSDPRLFGWCYEYDADGQLLYQYHVDARNDIQDNVSAGHVTFVAPQGHCPGLRAQATVGGSQTTFGDLELDIIGGGEVVIDIGGPGLALAGPEAGLCVDASQVEVSGTATDDVGVAGVTVNGSDALLDPAGGEGTLETAFSATVALALGANTLTTIATDTAGKTGSDTRTVYRDGGPPSLAWSPADGATTTEFSIDVSGTVSDDVGIDSVTVNGVPVALTPTANPNEYHFATPVALDLGPNNLTVSVTEETGCSDLVQVRRVTVIENLPPSADAGGPYTVDEGGSVALDGTASSDPDGDPLSFEWDLDYDGSTFDVDVSGLAMPDFSAAGLDGPATRAIALRVTDPDGANNVATAEVAITNVAPDLGELSGPSEPVAIGTPVVLGAAFSDAGLPDTHAATWDWGDGTTPGTVTQGSGQGGVEDSHAYPEPGVYTVGLSLDDDDGGRAEGQFQYVVVYDPDGSFVTGGGTIDSPPGAYAADPSLAGMANFGFVSKYRKGATVPTGHTEFQFHAAGLDFKSTDYQWLVVAGAQAKFKGTGTIKGLPGVFGFMISATDGQASGGGGTDRFRIKIWDAADEAVVYDNEPGAAADAEPATALRSGSIVIHSKGKQ